MTWGSEDDGFADGFPAPWEGDGRMKYPVKKPVPAIPIAMASQRIRLYISGSAWG
jgi:hypothetical protein